MNSPCIGKLELAQLSASYKKKHKSEFRNPICSEDIDIKSRKIIHVFYVNLDELSKFYLKKKVK